MANARTLRDEHREATRAALIDSGRKLFAEQGFAGASLDDIARDARVSKGAIYHHFGSKVDLFQAVYRTIEEEVETASAVAASSGRSPIDAILLGVDAYLDAAMAPDVQRITLIDAPAVLGSDADIDADKSRHHENLRNAILLAIDSGSMKPIDAGCLAHLIRGGCLQAAILIARSPRKGPTRERVGATLATLIRGLVPAE